LFEKGLAVETLMFLSAQLFVETDLLLMFPPELFHVSMFLETPPLFECLLFLPLRLRLGSLSIVRHWLYSDQLEA
jgi:hypothetical protein